MPPGPVYNWLAVAHSALVILDHALQYRAARVTRAEAIRVLQSRQRGARGSVYESKQEEVKDVEELVASTADEPLSSGPNYVQPSSLLHANEAWLRQIEIATTPRTPLFETVPEQQLRGDTTVASTLLEPSSSSTTLPGIAERQPSQSAAEALVLATDSNLATLDVSSSYHLPIPESDAPPDDVLNRLPNLL